MRLFLYGTLMQGGCNAVAAALHGKLGAGAAACARGRLYALPDPAGWYPAFIPDRAGGPVHGMVHATGPAFTRADLAALDVYEDSRPEAPAAGEYLRRAIGVSSMGRRLRAQAWVYNAPLPPDARPVPGGDFRAFLAAEGLPEFR